MSLKVWIGVLFVLAAQMVMVTACTAETGLESPAVLPAAENAAAVGTIEADLNALAGDLPPLQQLENTAVPESGSGQDGQMSSAQEQSLESTQAASPGGSGDVVVEVTPLTETELAQQPPGQSPPGAAEITDDPQAAPPGGSVQNEGRWGPPLNYSNSDYKFGLTYPAGFAILSPKPGVLYQLPLNATASFAFMNPETAASDALEYEIGDLEISVYQADPALTLEDWLQPTGFLEGMSQQPFQTANVSGIQVCQTSMMAPGCTFFVKGTGWIYQLTPATLEGEAAFRSFMLLP